jgi:hypothetical protein
MLTLLSFHETCVFNDIFWVLESISSLDTGISSYQSIVVEKLCLYDSRVCSRGSVILDIVGLVWKYTFTVKGFFATASNQHASHLNQDQSYSESASFISNQQSFFISCDASSSIGSLSYHCSDKSSAVRLLVADVHHLSTVSMSSTSVEILSAQFEFIYHTS